MPGRCGLYSRFAAEFSLDECNNILHGVKVLGSCHLVILHGDGKTILKEHDQLDSACGIDHTTEQGRIVRKGFGTAKQEVVDQEASDLALDLCCLHCLVGHFCLVCELRSQEL